MPSSKLTAQVSANRFNLNREANATATALPRSLSHLTTGAAMETERVFPVRKGYVACFRGRALVFVAMCLMLLRFVSPKDFRAILGMPFLCWAPLPFVIAVSALFAWLSWRNLPWRATGRQLRIGTHGVDYKVGRDQIHRDWTQIASVHPTRKPGWIIPTIVWLSAQKVTAPDSLGARDLWLAMVKAA